MYAPMEQRDCQKVVSYFFETMGTVRPRDRGDREKIATSVVRDFYLSSRRSSDYLLLATSLVLVVLLVSK